MSLLKKTLTFNCNSMYLCESRVGSIGIHQILTVRTNPKSTPFNLTETLLRGSRELVFNSYNDFNLNDNWSL